MHSDPVRQYYASFAEREWLRLDSDEGAIEFRVNTHFLDRHLPAGGRIPDLGGGPGRYAEWLATRGHRVVLADLSPELLALARDRVTSPLIEEITEADERRHLADEAFVHGLMTDGIFDNDVPGRFTHGWGVRPDAIAPWFERFGLETIALITSEGLAASIEPAFAAMKEREPAAFEAAMTLVIETATEPSLLGSAKHLLYLARNPEALTADP
jgi:SAM-dependent methyltransferase